VTRAQVNGRGVVGLGGWILGDAQAQRRGRPLGLAGWKVSGGVRAEREEDVEAFDLDGEGAQRVAWGGEAGACA
jgi:hypothetical protein